MTTINIDERFTLDDLGSMIRRLDELKLIPEAVEYLIDDLDDGFDGYAPDSPTFISLNDVTAELDETSTILTYRMLLEIIVAELDDARAEIAREAQRIRDLY